MYKDNLAWYIYSSCVVEGLDTTVSDVRKMLNNQPISTRSAVRLFVRNMYDAWMFLLDNICHPLNIMFIRELNKICGTDIIYGAGELRSCHVSISGTEYTPPVPIQAEVEERLQAINSIANPRRKAIEIFCYLAKSQLFVDGNKRVSQLAANKILIENKIGILEIDTYRIDTFRKLLVEYYEGKSDGIKQFLDECIAESK